MTERKSDKPAVIIAVALLAIILIGEVIVYTSDYTDYSAEAGLEGDSLGYQVSADGSKTYSVVVNDNGTYDGIDRLYIYFDESYPANYEDVDVSIGAQALDQKYYLEQVVNLLKPRNFHDITYVDAEQLADALAGDLASDGCGTAGLLVISGVLPDTVYTGNADDAIFQWMSGGGSLYWLGNLIGECYATTDGLQHVDGYQELFFGAECLNTGGIDTAYSEVDGNGYTHALASSLKLPVSVETALREMVGYDFERASDEPVTAGAALDLNYGASTSVVAFVSLGWRMYVGHANASGHMFSGSVGVRF